MFLKENNFTKNKAFTLIELMVVIAIIGVLSAIVTHFLQPARQKTADAKRISDYRTLTTALELYFYENNTYPGGLDWFVVSNTPDWNNKFGNSLQAYLPSMVQAPDNNLPYWYVGNPEGSGNIYQICRQFVCIYINKPCFYLRIPVSTPNNISQNDNGLYPDSMEFLYGSGCSIH
jgi:prepilin-type N-terminal cleavage/methylation domain-containing protein